MALENKELNCSETDQSGPMCTQWVAKKLRFLCVDSEN